MAKSTDAQWLQAHLNDKTALWHRFLAGTLPQPANDQRAPQNDNADDNADVAKPDEG